MMRCFCLNVWNKNIHVGRLEFHLYKFGEMEQYLREIGFSKVKTYASFSKELAASDNDEMFLFECME